MPLLLFFFLITLSFAQTDSLKTTVIKGATGWSTHTNQLSGSVSTIGKNDLHNPHLADLPTVLKSSPHIFLQKSQQGGGSPQMRGLGANRILSIVDGIPLNNPITRGGNSHNLVSLDPFGVNQIEIYAGPGNVRFGSGALGGVIHISSSAPHFNDTFNLETKQALFYQSATEGLGLSSQTKLQSKNWAYQITLSLKKFHDSQKGSWNPWHDPSWGNQPYFYNEESGQTEENTKPRIQKSSGYSAYGIKSNIAYKINSKSQVEYILAINSTDTIPRYDKNSLWRTQENQDWNTAKQDRNIWNIPSNQSTISNPKYEVWSYGPQTWMYSTLGYKKAKVLNFDSTTSTLGVQNWKESRITQKHKQIEQSHQIENVYGLHLRNEALKRFYSHSLTLGFETQYFHTLSEAYILNTTNKTQTPTTSRYPGGYNEEWSTGIWALNDQQVSRKLILLYGLRGNLIHNIIRNSSKSKFFDTTLKETYQAYNAQAGLCFLVTPKNQLCSQLASGFRSPNLDDLGKTFEVDNGAILLPNTALTPEKIYSLETSLRSKPTPKFSFELGLWSEYLDDYLVKDYKSYNGKNKVLWNGDSLETLALLNSGNATLFGIDFSNTLNPFKDISIESQIQWMTSQTQDNSPLRHQAPLHGKFKITQNLGLISFEFSSEFSQGKTNNELSTEEKAKPYLYALDENGNPYTPAWWTADFFIFYKGKGSFQTSLGVENIFDFSYRPAGSGIHSTGRNFKTAVQWGF